MANNGTVDALDSIRKRLKALHDGRGLSWRVIAQRGEFCGLSHATLRDIAVTGRASTRTRRRLGLPAKRTRLAADVTPAQRDALRALVAERGMTWSEYCRALADEEMLRRDDDE